MQHSNRRFVWKFSVRTSTVQQILSSTEADIPSHSSGVNRIDSDDDDDNDPVISVSTSAFLVVRQRLKISVGSGCKGSTRSGGGIAGE